MLVLIIDEKWLFSCLHIFKNVFISIVLFLCFSYTSGLGGKGDSLQFSFFRVKIFYKLKAAEFTT